MPTEHKILSVFPLFHVSSLCLREVQLGVVEACLPRSNLLYIYFNCVTVGYPSPFQVQDRKCYWMFPLLVLHVSFFSTVTQEDCILFLLNIFSFHNFSFSCWLLAFNSVHLEVDLSPCSVGSGTFVCLTAVLFKKTQVSSMLF